MNKSLEESDLLKIWILYQPLNMVKNQVCQVSLLSLWIYVFQGVTYFLHKHMQLRPSDQHHDVV